MFSIFKILQLIIQLNFESTLIRTLSESKNFVEINNSVLNYLMVNGYKRSFDLFNDMNRGEVNLKVIANHKDKINKVEEIEGNFSRYNIRNRINDQLRKDSESFRSREHH